MTHLDPPATAAGVDFLAPRARTAASWLGLVLSVVLIALGVVLVHDALVRLGTVGGEEWITAVADAVGTVRPGTEVAVIGVVLGLLGLVLVIGALRPRRRLGAQVTAGNGQYVLPVDVARLASAAARRVDGVLDARSSATRTTVQVVARTTGDPGASGAVRSAVQDALSVLEHAPRVRVRTRADDDEDVSS